MSVHLATHDLEPDLLDELASIATADSDLAAAFRAACESVAQDGWVNPNLVRLAVLDHPAYEARAYAAQWGPACGRNGFMAKTKHPVQITGAGSRGNGGKSIYWRRLVVES